MIKSGLTPQIVIAKINLSEAKFDTSTAALIKLGEAKVPDTVVVAMMEKEQQRTEARIENNRAIDSDSRTRFTQRHCFAKAGFYYGK